MGTWELWNADDIFAAFKAGRASLPSGLREAADGVVQSAMPAGYQNLDLMLVATARIKALEAAISASSEE